MAGGQSCSSGSARANHECRGMSSAPASMTSSGRLRGALQQLRIRWPKFSRRAEPAGIEPAGTQIPPLQIPVWFQITFVAALIVAALMPTLLDSSRNRAGTASSRMDDQSLSQKATSNAAEQDARPMPLDSSSNRAGTASSLMFERSFNLKAASNAAEQDALQTCVS